MTRPFADLITLIPCPHRRRKLQPPPPVVETAQVVLNCINKTAPQLRFPKPSENLQRRLHY